MLQCLGYLYGFAIGDHGQHARGDWATRFGKLSIDPLGLRTDLMWDRLVLFATDDSSAPGTPTWDERLTPPLFARHPGDEEDFDDEIDDEDEEIDDEDFDDEDDLDDDFDEEDDLDEDIDDEIDEEIDDLDVDDEEDDLDADEDDDFDEEDEDLEDI